MMRTGEARARLEAEFGVSVTRQTIVVWLNAGKVKGAKVGGRYFVDWESLAAMVHDVNGTPQR
jgi:hypothetical protein